MTRRLLLPLALLAVLVVLGVRAAADPHPHGSASAHPTPAAPTTTTSTPTDLGPGVVWAAGPWGQLTLSGHRLLVPASASDGPLVDHGGGWATGYRPTATGAAIAALRHGLFIVAAPPALHAQVDRATLTPGAVAEDLTGPIRNAEPAWTLPAAVRAAADRVDVRLLGVVVDLTGRTARATVYQALASPDGDVITATGYRLVHAGDQWRIDTVDPSTVVPGAPEHYTLPAPSEDR